jgi:hypothetical protein
LGRQQLSLLFFIVVFFFPFGFTAVAENGYGKIPVPQGSKKKGGNEKMQDVWILIDVSFSFPFSFLESSL